MKNKIKILRKEKKITQEDLAQAVEVTRQTIISLEAEKYNPSLELSWRITKALGQKNLHSVFLLN